MSNVKYPYVIKILNDRLILEKQYLEKFHEIKERYPESAEVNIKSCEYRIRELITCLEFLKAEL